MNIHESGALLSEAPQNTSVLQRSIEIAFQPGVELLKSLGSAPESVVAEEFNKMLARQIKLSKEISEYDSGLKLKSLQLSGVLIKEEISSGGEFESAEMLAACGTLLPDIVNSINSLTQSDERQQDNTVNVTGIVFSAVSELMRTFMAFPMGNDPKEATEYFLHMAISLAYDFADGEDVINKDEIFLSLMPGLVDVIQFTWGQISSAVLNPSGAIMQIKDVENELHSALYPLMVDAPLGHDGNETSVIRVISGYIFDLALLKSKKLATVNGAPFAEDYKYAILKRFLLPICPIAWRSLTESIGNTVDTVKEADMSNWLLENAAEPVDIGIYMDNIKRLAASRSDPAESSQVDMQSVRKLCEDRITSLFAIVSAVRSLLPTG